MSSVVRRNSRSRSRVWTVRAINVIGALTVTIAIMWETGLTSVDWWQRFTAPKPTPIAKAPPRPPAKPIGIAPVAPKGSDSSVSAVPLPLLLVRVLPGRTAGEGTAQIGVVRESPQTYQAGALLENGARLAEIHSDYVLLEKNGHTSRLYLDESKSRAAGDQSLLTAGASKEAPPPAKITSREVLTDYIRPSPVYVGGTLIGYQVYPGAKTLPFSHTGLLPGDVITDIDGISMTDPATSWSTLRQLTEGDSFTAVVQRAGATVTITLDGRAIAEAEAEKEQQAPQAMLTPTN